MKAKLVMISLLASATSVTLAEEGEPWSELAKDKICVAYHAEKRMLLVADVEVLGTTCEVKISLKQVGPSRLIVVEISSSSFTSGNSMRDDSVVEALGGKGKTPVIFDAEMPAQGAAVESPLTLSGNLTIQGKPHPLVVVAERVTTGAVRVAAKTSFSKLGLEAPEVVGGIVASVRDDLVLYAQVPAKDVGLLLQKQ